jgi:hypothetical protein
LHLRRGNPAARRGVMSLVPARLAGEGDPLMPASTLGFLLSFVVFLGSCAAAPASPLPDARPADFEIAYNRGGGMVPYGEGLRLSASGGTYSLFNHGIQLEIAFAVKPDDLDRLYRLVKENRFDAIQTEQQKVYDRGGTSLQVTAAGRVYNVADSGMSFVKEPWRKQFAAVADALEAFARGTGREGGVEAAIVWDESLYFKHPRVAVDAGDAFLGANDDSPSSQSVRLRLAARRAYTVTIELDGASGGEPVKQTVSLDLTKAKTLRMRFADGKVVAAAE